MPEVKIELRAGDVVSYLPKDGPHCREATAIVVEDGRAFDTFWGPERDQYSHWLTPSEKATVEVEFNLDDFEPLDRYASRSAATWKTYHPDDRARIGSQHGLQQQYYVRKGARPDRGTQIKNAEVEVAEAEEAVRSAERRLEWKREDLATLVALEETR